MISMQAEHLLQKYLTYLQKMSEKILNFFVRSATQDFYTSIIILSCQK